ncbi:protein MMS22-like isoform X2 [Ostrea edulis]|uniref:protein MMS22-like isoform X2 n=1 Tax=Ostrea edulis TaxID=37623 RepID=UPI0024AF8064|nr:protein MMS22-like isoform X2 [Ostrea edulis]
MEFEDSESFFPLISEDNILMTPPRESDSDDLMDIEFSSPYECSTCKKNTAELKRYLKSLTTAAPPLVPHSMELFDQVFLKGHFQQQNRNNAFMMMRQWMNIINNPDSTWDAKNKVEYRQDIVKFLEFVKYFIASDGASRDVCEDIVKEIHGVLLYSDRLSEFEPSDLGVHEMNRFHSCLDVYVGVLKILHIIEIKSTDSSSSSFLRKCVLQNQYPSSESDFESMVHLLVWELVTLAKKSFKLDSFEELQTKSPFVCSCVSEAWKHIKMLVDNIHKDSREESFYVLLFDIIKRILQEPSVETSNDEMNSNVYEYPPRVLFDSDNAEFCLWILVHMSKMAGNITQQNLGKKVTEMVSTVLKSCLSKDSVTEGQLRFVVSICQDLHTDTRASILNLLWEYFYKKMNNSFAINTRSFDSTGRLSKSIGQQLELCTRISKGESKTSDNSYIRFLSILCRTLQEKGSLSSEWKQTKGRIFSKFHIRRMQELTDTGLHNFFCLFLSLAVTADTEEIVSRMCKYSDMISGVEDLAVRGSLMKGRFAAVLLYIQRNVNVNNLAEKLADDFNSASMKLGQDEMRRYNHWTVVCAYLEHVTEVFERSSDVELSQYLFIGDGIGRILDSCKSSEISTIVISLQEILSKCRDIISRSFVMTASNSAMYAAVMTNISPSLRTLCCSVTAPLPCADLLAALCLLSVDCKTEEDFVSIFKFSLSESINKRDFMQVPAVREMFTVSGMAPPEDGQIIHFIQAIQKTYDKTTGWKERMCLRDKVMQFFVDIHKHIAPVMHALHPADILKNVYAVLGYLVKHCAPVLFVQSKPDCPLPNILTALIVPHFMFNADKPPKSAFVNIVGQHLHQFVIGLSKLEYRRATYVNRKLGDIVTIYLPKYWSSSLGPARSHPLVLSLKSSFSKSPSETDLAFRHFMLELVCEKYLQLSHHSYNPNHQYAIKFLLEVIKHTTDPEVVESDCRIILCPILKVDLLTSTHQSKLLIQNVMEAVCLSQQKTDISNVCTILSKFVKDHKKGHLEAVFNTLHKLPPKCGPYISQISPQLQHCVIENEAFRGVGRDGTVRSKYYQLMKHFNLEGQCK